ncbi:12334_t:CDS:2, partial [Ambispora leptoticha]
MTLTIDMATKTATPKTQKPKVNNFVLVLEQFLEKHNLTADSTPKQLSEHAPKLDALLPDWMARRCVKVALARGTGNRRSFSGEQVEALLPDKRKRKLTIEERAKYCAKIGDVMDIFAHHLDLGPKNDYENEIVASGSHQSQFRVKLAEAGVSPKIINTYAKDPKLIQESNKIQKKQTMKRMANPDRIPTHFSLANVNKRIQNMDVSKIPTREDLVDIIVMLSMRPAEVRSLRINHYELDHSNIPAWYKDGYSWYCTDAIKAKKLSDPVFTGKGTRNAWPFNEFLKQEPYRTIPKKLRDYGSKHASRIHGGKKPTPQHLKLLSRIAMRQESDRFDAGDNYAIGDTESEDDMFIRDTINWVDRSSPPSSPVLEPEKDKVPAPTQEQNNASATQDKISVTNFKNLAFNILKYFDDPIVKNEKFPELDKCVLCNKEIFSSPIKSFTTLACGHVFHRICIDKEILLTKENVCPVKNCKKSIEILDQFSRRDSESSTASIVRRMEKYNIRSPQEIHSGISLEGGSTDVRSVTNAITIHTYIVRPAKKWQMEYISDVN